MKKLRILGPLPAPQLTRDIVRKTFFYLLKYNHGFLSPWVYIDPPRHTLDISRWPSRASGAFGWI